MINILEQLKNWYLRTFKADEVKIISDGLVQDTKDNRDYIFGAENIHNKVLREDGQWADLFTPESETQKKSRVDTMSCVSFALMNALEFLAFYKWGENWNKSDRYVAKMSNTTRSGNSMNRVAETVRTISGTVDEEAWPFSDNMTWDTYHSPVANNVVEEGKLWLKRYEMKHSRVIPNHKLMMKALKYSPLWVGGFAWAKSRGLYRSWGRANHAFLIVGYKENKYWLAWDSYAPYVKKLDWNFKFPFVKSVALNRQDFVINQTFVNKLIKEGKKYILLVEPYETFDAGAYELTDKGIIKANLLKLKDDGVIVLAKEGVLQPRNAKDFVKLFK